MWGFGFIRLLYFVTFGVLDLSILSRQRKTFFSDNWLFFYQNPHEIIICGTTRTSNWTKTSENRQPCSKNSNGGQFFFWIFDYKTFRKKLLKTFSRILSRFFGEKTFRYRAFLMPWHQLKYWASELKTLFFLVVLNKLGIAQNTGKTYWREKTNSSSKLYQNRKNWCFWKSFFSPKSDGIIILIFKNVCAGRKCWFFGASV